ncbi:MAG: transcriptional regulator [Planctomycetota bacterium]
MTDRTPAASTSDYARTLDRLLQEIDTLPAAERNRLRHAADEAKVRHERLVGTIAKLQETLDFLRLGVKYLAFDVEATKRENAYLRKLLEEADGVD